MGIAGEIAEGLRDTRDSIADTVGDIAEDVAEKVDDFVEDVADVVSEIGEEFREGFQAGTEALKPIVEEAWERGIKIPLDAAIEKIEDIGEIVLEVQEQAQEILDSIGQKLLEELLEYLSTLSIVVELKAKGYARVEVSTSLFSYDIEFDVCKGFTYQFELLDWTKVYLFYNFDNGLITFEVKVHDKVITKSWVKLKFAIPAIPIPSMMLKQCEKEEDEEPEEGECPPTGEVIRCFNASDTLKGGSGDNETKKSFRSFLEDLDGETGGGTSRGGSGGKWGNSGELSDCPRIIHIGLIQNLYGDASVDTWGKNRTYEGEFYLYPERWGGAILSEFYGGSNPTPEELEENQWFFWEELGEGDDTEWWIEGNRENLQNCLDNMPRGCQPQQPIDCEINKKIPDVPLIMDKDCCSMIRQILDRLGGDDWDAILPESLTDGKDSVEKVTTIPDMMAKTIEYQDELAGSYPVEIEIEDSDLTQEGNQSISLEFPNQAEFLAEMYGMMYELLKNLTVTQELAFKAMTIAGLNQQALIKTRAQIETIQDYLDFNVNEREKEYKWLFTPNEQNWVKILEETELKVKIQEYDDEEQTLKSQLLELMQGAAIIRARYFRRIGDGFDFMKILKQGASLGADFLESNQEGAKDKKWEDWKDFIEDDLMKKYEEGNVKPDIKDLNNNGN